MVNPIPSRFTHYSSYLYKPKEKPTIQEIPKRKSKFFKLFDDDISEKIKYLVKEKNLNLDEKSDFVYIFNQIE